MRQAGGGLSRTLVVGKALAAPTVQTRSTLDKVCQQIKHTTAKEAHLQSKLTFFSALTNWATCENNGIWPVNIVQEYIH